MIKNTIKKYSIKKKKTTKNQILISPNNNNINNNLNNNNFILNENSNLFMQWIQNKNYNQNQGNRDMNLH